MLTALHVGGRCGDLAGVCVALRSGQLPGWPLDVAYTSLRHRHGTRWKLLNGTTDYLAVIAALKYVHMVLIATAVCNAAIHGLQSSCQHFYGKVSFVQ